MVDSQYVGGVADEMQFYIEVFRLEVVPADAIQLVSQSLVAQFGQSIELVGVDWEIEDVDMAQSVYVTLYWRAVMPVEESYKVFVHLLDQTGDLVAQHDSVPVNWVLPTNAWQPGDIIVDRHQVMLPQNHQIGKIGEIGIGMYHPENLQRLDVAVLDGDVRSVDGSIRLPWVVP